ncbi:hypothetical protein FFLO_03525 [Filobasidium floriforme]|uniref:NAD(P)H-hydrate epimerase n=1 Tax=Filobasidium floriforme TaxID=5210 RepID=A0A8K0NQR8_9TREE|nr:YjeF N-terminal domain-containing protein [Filobasidium floriforme]KAG7536005.1 hypothetical protein FFLO_03525 [Filobasidium floriforme]KAH8084836.1 YjeF N-terminal domain-containing protein [Filobasidium floriforme]
MASINKYLSAEEAAKIDQELMSEEGAYTLDQLMELAGLACAQTLAKAFPKDEYGKVLVITGPGNQGGDGLVAARHLKMFGYEPTVYQVAEPKKEIYTRLTRQCRNMDVPIVNTVEEFKEVYERSSVVMDTIFGFSFHPPVRPPYHTILNHLASPETENSSQKRLPILSIDIPSGWDVDSGRQPLKDTNGDEVETFEPEVLLSLTAPKEGVRGFRGRHWLGGRFIPMKVQEKYKMQLPPYPGTDQIVELEAKL